MKILVYGIGNPGRQDDGLGPSLVEELAARLRQETANYPAGVGHHEISFDANYQLNIEDAEAISEKDLVIFADAARGDSVVADGHPFSLIPVEPEPTASFSTHSVSPGGVVALCSRIYGAAPPVILLAIRGYSWEVNEPISDRARANLGLAVDHLAHAFEHADGHSLLRGFVA